MSKDNLLGAENLAVKMQKIKDEMNNVKAENVHKNHGVIKIKDPIKRADPKLFVSGKLDRKNHEYTARSLVILNSLEAEIKAYCRGGDLAILNYLIKEGLNKVKESTVLITVDVSDIETS